MLKKRILTSLLGTPLIIAAIWFDRPAPWFTIVMAVWGVLAVYEFYKITNTTKILPLTIFGLVWTLLFILRPHFYYPLYTPLLITTAVVVPLIGLILRREKEGSFVSWVWMIAGIFYMGWMLSHLVALRGVADGRNWVFFAMFTTWASDTIAYFVGRRFGKHKLAPSISPGKTWEGAIGGLIGAAAISILFFTPTPLQLPIASWQAILLGILVSVIGQIGDLAESLLKRNVGVKDSGTLVAGHGGFLDRIDSVVFAGVAVYYYVVFTTIY
jgi:phosphatidate cytidylyltransferase